MSKTSVNKANRKEIFGKDGSINALFKSGPFKSVLASIISILIGLFIGFLVMLIISIFKENMSIGDAFEGLFILLKGPFSSTVASSRLKLVGNTFFYATPLIFCGLSVAVAYKTGLFNIGAPGQYLMGTLGSLLVALSIDTTGNRFAGIMVWILAVIVGVLFAALWGMIPGLFKAFFGVNEVIVCIMTNWIAANLVTLIFTKTTSLHNISEKGKDGILYKTATTGNFSPTLGLDKITNDSLLDISIFIAIIVAIFLYILMNKTTLGYQLKACGANKNSAKYAGMNDKRNILLSMAIAGGLAGFAACLYFLNPGIEFAYNSAYQVLPGVGFNGIPVALLASNSPIGVIFTGLFFAHLNMGGSRLNGVNFNTYIADFIIAIIIYLSGFSKLFRDLLAKKKKEPKIEKVVVNEEGKIEHIGGKK